MSTTNVKIASKNDRTMSDWSWQNLYREDSLAVSVWPDTNKRPHLCLVVLVFSVPMIAELHCQQRAGKRSVCFHWDRMHALSCRSLSWPHHVAFLSQYFFSWEERGELFMIMEREVLFVRRERNVRIEKCSSFCKQRDLETSIETRNPKSRTLRIVENSGVANRTVIEG